MAHIPVRHPEGDLRSSKSAILPIRHRQTGGAGAATARPTDPLPRRLCAERQSARAGRTLRARQTSSETDEESTEANGDHRSPDEKRRSMTWAQCIKRVLLTASRPPPFGPAFRLFQIAPGDLVNIDVTMRGHFGGAVRIVIQHRRAHRHPRHPRPLRKAPRAGESALPTRPARTARRGRVPLRRPRRRRRNKARPKQSGNDPAAPCSARCRESARNGHGRRFRTPINPPKRSAMAPKPPLNRAKPTRVPPPTTAQPDRKGCSNLLYSAAVPRAR